MYEDEERELPYYLTLDRQPHDLFYEKIARVIGSPHLDYGCGKSPLTFRIAWKNRDSYVNVIGYDPDQELMAKLQERSERRGIWMRFTSDYDEVYDDWSPFESATLAFVLHETGHEVLRNLFGLLELGGALCITDYNIKGMGIDEFASLFISDAERAELEQMGLEEAHRIHTATGLEDCVAQCEGSGFATIESGPLNGKYYYWIGRRYRARLD